MWAGCRTASSGGQLRHFFSDSEAAVQCELFLTVPNRNILTYLLIYGQWLWDLAVKFTRWQNPAMSCMVRFAVQLGGEFACTMQPQRLLSFRVCVISVMSTTEMSFASDCDWHVCY